MQSPRTPSPSLKTILLLGTAYFLVFAGSNIWRSTFHNYALETYHVTPLQIGLLFSIAGVPGVLAFGVGFISKKVKAFLLMAISCASVGGGLIWLGMAPNWSSLWFGVLAISVGFTVFYPLITGFGLHSSAPEKPQFHMGYLKSFGPLAAIVSALLIRYTLQPVGYRFFLVITGVLVAIGGLVISFDTRKTDFAAKQGALKLRMGLWPYYALNFLAGTRSAIFKTFVLYLLISEHGLRIHQTAVLVLAGNICGFLSYRWIGKISVIYEPSKVLAVIYAGVAIIFFGFSVFDQPLVLSGLYCLDSLLFGVSVLTDSHLRKLSPPENFVGDLAVGLTLFHLAGVFLPPLAGLVWENGGAYSTFALASVLALIAALISLKL